MIGLLIFIGGIKDANKMVIEYQKKQEGNCLCTTTIYIFRTSDFDVVFVIGTT